MTLQITLTAISAICAILTWMLVIYSMRTNKETRRQIAEIREEIAKQKKPRFKPAATSSYQPRKLPQ